MNILALWMVNYQSATGEDYFRPAFESLGHTVDVVPLAFSGCDVEFMIKIASKRYDMIFHVPYRDMIQHELIRYAGKKHGIATVCFNGDDEWLWESKEKHNPKLISKFYDHVITTCEWAVPKYKEIGITPILSQWGYSSKDWKPAKSKKKFDIYACGSKNEVRDQWFNDIIEAGLPLTVHGPHYTGHLPIRSVVRNYRSSKIGLSILNSFSEEHPYSQIKMRVFEVPACGTFQMATHTDDLKRFFEIGKEIVTFIDIEDFKEKATFYLKHDSEREKIARAGHLRGREYSFQKIAKRFFSEMKS